MPTPNKPTKEELKAKEEEAIKAAEELEGRQQLPPDEEEEDDTPEVDDTPTEEGEEEEVADEAEEAEPSKEVKEQLKKEVEEKKKKLAASARENQKIYAKNRVINKALADAEDVPEPTEEELQAEFNDWDIMSDTEKVFAKETVISRNWRKTIAQAKEQATKIEKWNESVEDFVSDPVTLTDNPDLEGKTEEFKAFAEEETNNSVPFGILVSAFLHNHSTNKPNNKGRMFERGSGGPNDKPQPKDGSITLEEGRKLRETDYNKWKELLAQGKIKSDL
jgi:hypothetical protein